MSIWQKVYSDLPTLAALAVVAAYVGWAASRRRYSWLFGLPMVVVGPFVFAIIHENMSRFLQLVPFGGNDALIVFPLVWIVLLVVFGIVRQVARRRAK